MNRLSKGETVEFDAVREKLVEGVAALLSPERFDHTMRVEAMAVELARHYQVDTNCCQIAAILHDCAKEMPLDEMVQLWQKRRMAEDAPLYGSAIMHGPLGAFIARSRFKVSDPLILTAIECHTVGHQQMNPIAKILFVADFIERGRDFPGVEDLRKLAFEDLDAVILEKAKQNILLPIQRGQLVYPKSLDLYNHLMSQQKSKS